MKIPSETLMAFIDGELEAEARAEVAAALKEDPELQAQAAQYVKLRSTLESAYASELTEPVPERLLAVLSEAANRAAPTTAPDSNVTDLGVRRAQAAREAIALRAPRNVTARWRMVSLAAGVLLAVGVGLFFWRGSQPLVVRSADGSLVASGALALGLSDELSGESRASSKVSVVLSFVAKSGDYCRAFSLAGGAEGSGLACRIKDRWEIDVLSKSSQAEAGAAGEYRTAGSSLSPEVLSEVQAQISGEALDRPAEAAARGRGWRAAR
jgi:anti-sigma factor RsiW